METVINLSETDIDDVKTDTKYCVEKDVHNLHIQKSTAKGYPPLPVVDQGFTKPESIAIVCSGPSLKGCWEQVKMCDHVLTCSGAHDYMIERGIIPHFHMETDPRPHKAAFTRNPDKRTMYLIASSCHPDVFQNLEGMDVRLWHVVPQNELHRMPRGHWMVTGGCNVGLRAMVVARLMGYVDVHIFGMDCCSDEKKVFHVNSHPNEPKQKSHRVVKVGDREFISSGVFIECARQFFKETMLLSDTRVTLHGDGMLQAIAQHKMSDPKQIEKRKKFIEDRGGACIALSLPDVISQNYAALNKQLHEENWHYGGHGDRYVSIIKKMVDSPAIKSVLDYGCGKGALAAALDFPIWEYDPCVPGKEAPPRPADLVICTDVLEHIEPEKLTAVLEDLVRVIKVSGFFAIHTKESSKTLADGRNSHLIRENMDWWKDKLSRYFNVNYCGYVTNTPVVFAVVSPRRNEVKKAA